MSETFGKGLKNLTISLRTSYPIITSYEFESLKMEKVVKERLDPSTLYLIVQRPLIYFHNVRQEDEKIKFEITDSKGNEPLVGEFNPWENDFVPEGKDLILNVGFYKKERDKKPPFNHVASMKLYTEDEEFIVWYTPQKLMHELLQGSLKGKCFGDLNSFVDYHLHYVGQAFSQKIWKRLTGHEKMQSILTMEEAMDGRALKNSYEISLIILRVLGYSENCIFPLSENKINKEMIIHDLKNMEAFLKFSELSLPVDAPELTNETEAFLINMFKPEYNKRKFKNYPKIKRGTRNAGYTECSFDLEMVLANLSTANFSANRSFPKFEECQKIIADNDGMRL